MDSLSGQCRILSCARSVLHPAKPLDCALIRFQSTLLAFVDHQSASCLFFCMQVRLSFSWQPPAYMSIDCSTRTTHALVPGQPWAARGFGSQEYFSIGTHAIKASALFVVAWLLVPGPCIASCTDTSWCWTHHRRANYVRGK